MVAIVNFNTPGGGFKHYGGLIPVSRGSGDPHHATVRPFHVDATNASAIYRGDIVVLAGTAPANISTGGAAASTAIGVRGGADLPTNIAAPSAASTVIGNAGGAGVGNNAMVMNVARWAPGDLTSVIAGVVVGFGPITLNMARLGFQYLQATMEGWLWVDTDPHLEMYCTATPVTTTAFNLSLGAGIDVKANATQQRTVFGISGVSLDTATIATTATLPLRILGSGEMIGNDVATDGFIAKVTFNHNRHAFGNGPMIQD